jgi:methionyl-tRNA formyltransferase
MHIINLSKREYKRLKPIILSKPITQTEADLYEFSYDGERKIIKTIFTLDKEFTQAKVETIERLNEYKNINPIKQFDALSSKCKKIKKDDGLVDFSVDSAGQIWAKFLAYYGWPGIFTKNGIKILDIEVANLNGGIGEILSINDNGFVVGVNNGSILIKTLQAAGKKPVDAKSYLNGKRLGVGDRVYL